MVNEGSARPRRTFNAPMRLLPFLLLASACAAGSAREGDLSSELAGRSQGLAQECVFASTGANLTPRDSRTLVYAEGGTIWVNRLEAACRGLDPMSTLIVEAHGTRYCRGDRIRAAGFGQSIPGPSCALGRSRPGGADGSTRAPAFPRYRPPERA
jgi:hypothetical protein